MYRYYQKGERDAWTPVAAKTAEEAERDARAAGATKLTVLSVNTLIRDELTPTELEAVAYKGPLYFDIDCKTDLPLALESANTLAQKLITLGIPAAGLEIYLSGSKGVHILVDMTYFSPSRAVRSLPRIYAEMARELYVPGLDFQVYSEGKGNSFRLANLKRDDGNYRIEVSLDELAQMTEPEYRRLVKSPRENVTFVRPAPVKCPELMSMFEDGKRRVGAKVRDVIIATDADLAKIREEPPHCVQKIVSWDGIRKEVRFNGVAMQLAMYIVRSGVAPVISDGLVSRLAEHGKSDQYGSVRERQNHVRGSVLYMERRENMKFGCNAMRALLDRRPCEGCPLEHSSTGQAGEDTLAASESREGYYIPTKDGRRRLTNFILKPIDVFIDTPQDGTTPRRLGTRTDILKNGDTVGHVIFHEESFNSRSGFLRELTGLAGLTFVGSDNDVQAIKNIFQSEEQDVGEIRQVYTAGIHIETIENQEMVTYVEPGMSINRLKCRDTHQLASKIAARPQFGNVEMAARQDSAVEEAMMNLLSVNDDVTVAALTGWFVACHFKTHLYYNYRQFPLLNLHGNAGSGKSKTAGLFTWLNGTRYEEEDSGVSLPSITPFAALEYFSCTLTVPRICDEFNKAKIRQNLYDYLSELMKAAWDGNTTMRGQLGKRSEAGRTGAVTVDIPITAPLVILSEQEIDIPALIERSIQLHMRKKGRLGREKQYKAAVKGRNKIQQLGKLMMGMALTTSTDMARDWFEELDLLITADLEPRPRYSAVTLLFGLERLRKLATEELEMPLLANRAQELFEILLCEVNDEGEGKTQFSHGMVSEIDAVMTSLGIMITVSRNATNKNQPIWITEGQEYHSDETYLYVDPILAHTNYVVFRTRHEGQKPIIDNYHQFRKLLREEPYFDGEVTHPGIISGRMVYRLRLDQMKSKGLDVSLFTAADLLSEAQIF